MTRQKGFSAIEILIALTVFFVLAGGVWVWQNQRLSITPTITSKPTIIKEPITTITSSPMPTVVSKITTISPTPTSAKVNPRLYINELAKFSLEFPADWRMPRSVYRSQITPAGDGPGPGWGFQISKTAEDNVTPPVLVVHNLGKISEVDLGRNLGCQWIEEPVSTLNISQTLIGGHTAKYFENVKLHQDLNKEVYYACIYVVGDPGFNIVWHDINRDKSPDLDQILSTFRFD